MKTTIYAFMFPSEIYHVILIIVAMRSFWSQTTTVPSMARSRSLQHCPKESIK